MSNISNRPPILGIIGGAGVAATNLLMTKIEHAYTHAGAFRDSHHPEILCHQATQVPSRSLFLEGRGESFIPEYQRIAQQLERSGSTLIAMCCNTAHAAYQEVSASVNVPVINLINETILRVSKSSAQKIALLASEGCVLSGIYQHWFSVHCPEKTLVIVTPEQQAFVTLGIVNIKNAHRFSAIDASERPNQLFHTVIDQLYEQGCDGIIMGCTDIAVDFDAEKKSNILLFDSLGILVEILVEKLMGQLPGNANAMHFYNNLSATIQAPEETKNKAIDGSAIDRQFILDHSPNKNSLLDLGAGTGLLVNGLIDHFDRVVAVEKFPSFSRFIQNSDNLKIINNDLIFFDPSEKFSTVTIFACLNYFNFFEATAIYRKAWKALSDGGTLIVKHQMGVNDTVLINRVSKELGQYYFSQYRSLRDEMAMLSLIGFSEIRSFDIYPADYNLHSNTHYFAITATK
jgi:aspartate racemase